MTTPRLLLRSLPFLILTLFLASCGDRSVTAPESSDTRSVEASASLKVLVATGEVIDGTQTVEVRFVPTEGTLGAYQGRLHFDAGLASLSDVALPDKGFHVVNDQRKGEGELRFAGFRAEGFVEGTALHLRFETSEALAATDLEVDMEVVGDVKGARIPSSRIQAVREVE